MGPKGDTGEQGPKGDTGSMSQVFLHVNRITDQIMVAQDNVSFDGNVIKMGACNLDTTNSENILIWEPGYYHLYFNIYHTEPCQFSVFLNNIIVAESTVGSPTGSSQNSSTEIIYISANDVLFYATNLSSIGTAAYLNFRNHTSFSQIVTLNGQFGSGSVTPQITANVSLFKLA